MYAYCSNAVDSNLGYEPQSNIAAREIDASARFLDGCRKVEIVRGSALHIRQQMALKTPATQKTVTTRWPLQPPRYPFES
jgi:hypothetical protein